MISPRAEWRVRKPTARPEEPRLDGLLEEDTDAIPVRITIVQDDVVTGWDDGALGFEDGALWFSGRATSFRLLAPDILPGAYLLSRREPVTSGEALRQGLPLRHPTRKVWVRVSVLTKDKEAKAGDEARLIEGVKRLRSEPLAPPGERGRGEGSESEYPPLTPRPGLIRPTRDTVKRRRARILLSGFGAMGLVFQALSTHNGVGTLASLIGLIGAGCLLATLAVSGDSPVVDMVALRRIADEEAEPSPVRLSRWH